MKNLKSLSYPFIAILLTIAQPILANDAATLEALTKKIDAQTTIIQALQKQLNPSLTQQILSSALSAAPTVALFIYNNYLQAPLQPTLTKVEALTESDIAALTKKKTEKPKN